MRTVRRKGSTEDRWNWDEFSKLQGSPWEPIPGRPGIEMNSNIGAEQEPREIIPREEPEDQPISNRRFKIEKEDVRKHGITQGCRGCARAMSTGKAVNHNEKCRDRFEDIFRNGGDARLLRQAERIHIDSEDSGTASGSGNRDSASPPMRSEQEDADMEQADDMEDGSSQGGWKMEAGC